VDNTEQATEPSLDGLTFVMRSSTASVVNSARPTTFLYRQHNTMVWGEYTGDTVSIGRFVGRRDGDSIAVRFVHANAITGEITCGDATSRIESGAAGLSLVEDFVKDGVAHTSVCVQAAAPREEGAPTQRNTLERTPHSIDGAVFVLESSTASAVDPHSPSTFEFHEASGLIWGSYSGDTVTFGHTVGVREDDILREWFVHEVKATREVLLGDCTTRIAVRADGRRELIEDFVLDGVPGRSVCVELSA
jgi:hypothetical protein